MFKAFGNLLHKTPWWGLVAFGLAVLAALTLFATPLHVLRLSDSGKNPEEQRAIKREIQIAFGDSALNMAEEVVASLRAHWDSILPPNFLVGLFPSGILTCSPYKWKPTADSNPGIWF